jgi:hypothetical protein
MHQEQEIKVNHSKDVTIKQQIIIENIETGKVFIGSPKENFVHFEKGKIKEFEEVVFGELFKAVNKLEELYEITTNHYFLEKPYKPNEFGNKIKKGVFYFGSKVEEAIEKINSKKILFITGNPNVGKSTFLLLFLHECLEKNIKNWDTIIFINRSITIEGLDSIFKNIEKKYGVSNILLVIDGFHLREEDMFYIKKCLKLFRAVSTSPYRLIITLREHEINILKRDFENIKKYNKDIWKEINQIAEIKEVSFKSDEMKKIVENYLNYYNIVQNLKKSELDNCINIIVKKSGNLAGFSAYLIEYIVNRGQSFNINTVKQYPEGMTNLIWYIIEKDYYLENDKLIPLLFILLTKIPYSFTSYFFDSFKNWGIKVVDQKLQENEKNKILKKINNFVESYSIQIDKHDVKKYKLFDYWIEAIKKKIIERNNNKGYEEVVEKFIEMEKELKFWIEHYIKDIIEDIKNQISSQNIPLPETFYLVADIAKLWPIKDEALEFSTEFFKKYHSKYSDSLPYHCNYLKKYLSFLWRTKAETLRLEEAKQFYEKALEIDKDDFRSLWNIGEYYESKGEDKEALSYYIRSAFKQNTGEAYGSAIEKLIYYNKK